jgi:MFS-type transporter involved in bile tolerance (Atg22 family)
MAETRHRSFYFLAILFRVAPFAFGLIRATQASDYRMLWMALASLLGAALVGLMARRHGRDSKEILAISVVILAVATLLAGLTARLLGATAAAGIWPVAIVFGLCWAISYWLGGISRGRPQPELT